MDKHAAFEGVCEAQLLALKSSLQTAAEEAEAASKASGLATSALQQQLETLALELEVTSQLIKEQVGLTTDPLRPLNLYTPFILRGLGTSPLFVFQDTHRRRGPCDPMFHLQCAG